MKRILTVRIVQKNEHSPRELSFELTPNNDVDVVLVRSAGGRETVTTIRKSEALDIVNFFGQLLAENEVA